MLGRLYSCHKQVMMMAYALGVSTFSTESINK